MKLYSNVSNKDVNLKLLCMSTGNRVDPFLGFETDYINIESEDKSIIMSVEDFWYGWKLILWVKWIQ